MNIGVLCVCAHCGIKEFFAGTGVNCDISAIDAALEAGWTNIKTADQELELCSECYDDYKSMIRAFRLGTTYRMPSRNRDTVFKVNRLEESDINGSEQPAKEQPALEPADTTAESIARAKAIREAGSDRCQGL